MPLTTARDTISRAPDILVIPVAANAVIFQGSLVAVSATGFATRGAVATTLTAAGRAEELVDNTGGADGAKSVRVRRGVYRWRNLGADPVTQASMLKTCFIADDDAVAATNGGNTRSAAGKVVEIDAAGVWVETL